MAHPTPPHHIYPCLLLFLLLLATHEEVVAKRVQVFGFAVLDTPTYKGYDWSVLTTSAWRTDPELIDIANQHGAKVELNAGDVTEIMGDADKRKAWVSRAIAAGADSGGCDGCGCGGGSVVVMACWVVVMAGLCCLPPTLPAAAATALFHWLSAALLSHHHHHHY